VVTVGLWRFRARRLWGGERCIRVGIAALLVPVVAACTTTTTSGSDGAAPLASGATGTYTPVRVPEVREARAWPFAADSIWNVAIGSGARYVPAGIEASEKTGVFVEEEILVLEPDAPLVTVTESRADWDLDADRCVSEGGVLDRVPIPPGFTTDAMIPGTPNSAAAVLRPDGRTLHQSQPFMVCGSGTTTSHYGFDDADLYGPGIVGSHGGSGLSALGGTIRLGELVPGAVIRHALKIVIDSRFMSYTSNDATPGYRWPASKADGSASPLTYLGQEPGLRMGSLLALPPDFPVDALTTEPARIIARAARDYGIYVVDSSGWDAYYLATEWSPRGRVIDEFATSWGMPFVQTDRRHPWSVDMATIVTAVEVVDNNTPGSVGGGGTPRAPAPPPFG